MAVYERLYATYAGPLTSRWRRIWVLTAYAYAKVFASRRLLAFFTVCFIPPLIGALGISLKYNLPVLATLGINPDFLEVDVAFFRGLLGVQSGLAMFLTLLVAPGLVAADLEAGALPLILSRSISKAEYVAGKVAVIALMVSAITWVPALVLLGLDSAMGGTALTRDPLLPVRLWLAGMVPALVLALPAVAVSAWVRWRPIASGALLGLVLVPSGFGGVANELLSTRYGDLLNVSMMVDNLMRLALGRPTDGPPAAAFAAMFALVVAASLGLVWAKVVAYSVTE